MKVRSRYSSFGSGLSYVHRTTWRQKTAAGTLRLPSSVGYSGHALSTAAVREETKAQTCGRRTACSAPACTRWKTCSPIATGVKLRCGRWDTSKCSAMLATKVGLSFESRWRARVDGAISSYQHSERRGSSACYRHLWKCGFPALLDG